MAGGGTGGHLFPGVAAAREMVKRKEGVEILFVTGRKAIESEILRRNGFLQTPIMVEGIKGRGWKKAAVVLLRLPWSMLQSFMIIRRFSPQLVLGMGGYSAGPVCVAAKMMGIPSAIHEQNSFPGLTNRLLCRIVDRVFISFEESREHFPGGTIVLTGNPVREELLAARERPFEEEKKFTILIMGGSQGARAINEAFLEALGVLRDRGRDPMVIHQTGRGDHSQVLENYRKRGFEGRVVPFIEDMVSAYREADMVISRAGATTVSELAALGKPSILIPYPHAANRHQETNALILVRAGGAEMILQQDLSGEALAALLMRYMEDRAALKKMGESARAVGRPDAVRIIADMLMDMMKR
ncbi:MAG: undecaprenyldiphospho-muramoylpentapeptide beta-N-acetylglucosaminyltransferase [Desulfobacterales bacterium]|nr:undecaprenyldiphospho-muramoylpentapeptide beta-N-acetylglucosaminyltransferase [Desulfobacterales bacterium]